MPRISQDYDNREQPPPAYDDREQQSPALPDEKKSPTTTTKAVDNPGDIDGSKHSCWKHVQRLRAFLDRREKSALSRSPHITAIWNSEDAEQEGIRRCLQDCRLGCPLDINENATDMQSSSLGKLARVVGGKRASLSEHDQRATSRSAEISSTRTARDVGKASGSNVS